jgi:hypothetical protein
MSKPSPTSLCAALSPLSREVLELYAAALPEVRFPDLDLATLHALADEVRDAQDEVDRLEAELRDARDRVAQCNAALDARAERALAYARIYAEGNPALLEQVQAVRSFALAEHEPSTPKKRGRPRKAGAAHEGQLEVMEMAAE